MADRTDWAYDHEACAPGLNLAADLLLAMAHEAQKTGNDDNVSMMLGIASTLRALAVDDQTFRMLVEGMAFAAPTGDA